jgi:hypothetical protein
MFVSLSLTGNGLTALKPITLPSYCNSFSVLVLLLSQDASSVPPRTPLTCQGDPVPLTRIHGMVSGLCAAHRNAGELYVCWQHVAELVGHPVVQPSAVARVVFAAQKRLSPLCQLLSPLYDGHSGMLCFIFFPPSPLSCSHRCPITLAVMNAPTEANTGALRLKREHGFGDCLNWIFCSLTDCQRYTLLQSLTLSVLR